MEAILSPALHGADDEPSKYLSEAKNHRQQVRNILVKAVPGLIVSGTKAIARHYAGADVAKILEVVDVRFDS